MLFLLLFLLNTVNPTAPNTAAAEEHEFHLSKCQIDYSDSDQALQISLHLFIDDLEDALREQGADKLFICSDKEHEEAEMHLFQYIQQRLTLKVDNQAVTYEFIGKEPSEDLQAVWCYLEISSVAPPKRLDISNDLLMEIFDDQKNIVVVSGPGKKDGYFLFVKGKHEDGVDF